MNIVEAKTNYENAAKMLLTTIKKELPIGTIIQANIGRATITGPVTGYGNWWSCPDEIRFTNETTGKSHRCTSYVPIAG